MLDANSMSAVQVFISGYVMKTVLSTFAALTIYVVLFPFRTIAKSIKERWAAQTEALVTIQTELTTQRTNCLATLQRQSKEQVDILKDIAETMKDTQIEQAKISGYLRGIS